MKPVRRNRKRVLITGIGGFIGGYLARRLVADGYRVFGLYQSELPAPAFVNEIHKASEGTATVCDLMDFEGLVWVMDEVQPNFIIHLAAKTEVEKSFYDPTGFSQTNYTGTVNLVEATRRLTYGEGGLELFVFSSTMETYGRVDKRLWTAFNEDTPQQPNAPYAVAKLACERYIEYAQATYGLPYCTLRQTNTYGRHDNDFFVVEQFITQMLKNPDEANFGYREPYRNFLYVDDLIDLYAKVLRNVDLVRNEVFCTGPPNAIQIEELADFIAAMLGWAGQINWGRKMPRPGEIYYLNSTHEKAHRILRWEPQVDLFTGLAKTINMWQRNYGMEVTQFDPEVFRDSPIWGIAPIR